MGECGCTASPIGKLPVGDHVIIVELYPGCEYCGADWAISLLRVDPKDKNDRWALEDASEAPTITFDQLGYWQRAHRAGARTP